MPALNAQRLVAAAITFAHAGTTTVNALELGAVRTHPMTAAPPSQPAQQHRTTVRGEEMRARLQKIQRLREAKRNTKRSRIGPAPAPEESAGEVSIPVVECSDEEDLPVNSTYKSVPIEEDVCDATTVDEDISAGEEGASGGEEHRAAEGHGGNGGVGEIELNPRKDGFVEEEDSAKKIMNHFVEESNLWEGTRDALVKAVDAVLGIGAEDSSPGTEAEAASECKTRCSTTLCEKEAVPVQVVTTHDNSEPEDSEERAVPVQVVTTDNSGLEDSEETEVPVQVVTTDNSELDAIIDSELEKIEAKRLGAEKLLTHPKSKLLPTEQRGALIEDLAFVHEELTRVNEKRAEKGEMEIPKVIVDSVLRWLEGSGGVSAMEKKRMLWEGGESTLEHDVKAYFPQALCSDIQKALTNLIAARYTDADSDSEECVDAVEVGCIEDADPLKLAKPHAAEQQKPVNSEGFYPLKKLASLIAVGFEEKDFKDRRDEDWDLKPARRSGWGDPKSHDDLRKLVLEASNVTVSARYMVPDMEHARQHHERASVRVVDAAAFLADSDRGLWVAEDGCWYSNTKPSSEYGESCSRRGANDSLVKRDNATADEIEGGWRLMMKSERREKLTNGSAGGAEVDGEAARVMGKSSNVTPRRPPYLVPADSAQVDRIQKSLNEGDRVPLVFETTSWEEVEKGLTDRSYWWQVRNFQEKGIKGSPFGTLERAKLYRYTKMKAKRMETAHRAVSEYTRGGQVRMRFPEGSFFDKVREEEIPRDLKLGGLAGPDGKGTMVTATSSGFRGDTFGKAGAIKITKNENREEIVRFNVNALPGPTEGTWPNTKQKLVDIGMIKSDQELADIGEIIERWESRPDYTATFVHGPGTSYSDNHAEVGFCIKLEFEDRRRNEELCAAPKDWLLSGSFEGSNEFKRIQEKRQRMKDMPWWESVITGARGLPYHFKDTTEKAELGHRILHEHNARRAQALRSLRDEFVLPVMKGDVLMFGKKETSKRVFQQFSDREYGMEYNDYSISNCHGETEEERRPFMTYDSFKKFVLGGRGKTAKRDRREIDDCPF